MGEPSLVPLFLSTGFADLVGQHEVGVLLERVVGVILQVDVLDIVQDHWLRGQLAEKGTFVLAAPSQELLLNIYIKVVLEGVEVEGRVLGRRRDDVLEDILALYVVRLVVLYQARPAPRVLVEVDHRI